MHMQALETGHGTRHVVQLFVCDANGPASCMKLGELQGFEFLEATAGYMAKQCRLSGLFIRHLCHILLSLVAGLLTDSTPLACVAGDDVAGCWGVLKYLDGCCWSSRPCPTLDV